MFRRKPSSPSQSFSLKIWVQSLAVDWQQLVMEIWLDPEFNQALATGNWQKEWDKTLTELGRWHTQTKITALTRKLEELDGLPAKTFDQDHQQQVILAQIRELISQPDKKPVAK